MMSEANDKSTTKAIPQRLADAAHISLNKCAVNKEMINIWCLSSVYGCDSDRMHNYEHNQRIPEIKSKENTLQMQMENKNRNKKFVILRMRENENENDSLYQSLLAT